MESDDHESKSVDILHPEILGKDDLVALLTQRYIKVDPGHSSKDDLIDLFHRTVMPLHQREPCRNRRGRSIKKVRQKLEARRRLKGDDSDEGSKVMLNIGSLSSGKNHLKRGQTASTSSSAFSASSPGTWRLKPPPIVSSKQRTLKLNSSATAATTAATSSAKPETESADGKGNAGSSPKKIAVVETPVQAKSTESMADARKGITGEPALANKIRKISLKPSAPPTLKIGIKRTAPVDVNGKTATTPSEETSKTASSSSSGEESSPKKKIKRIAWP